MKREIKTRQQLIERLNNIDRKCIDEGLHFHDLKTLYESKEYKLSSRDKADIKKVAAIEDDPETLKAYIDSKVVEEDLKEDLASTFKKIHDTDEYLWNLHNTDYSFIYDKLAEYGDINKEGLDKVFRKMPQEEQIELFNQLTAPYDEEEYQEPEDDLELTSDDMNAGYWYESLIESEGSPKVTGESWYEFISNIEDQTKYDVDSSYKRRPEKWIELIDKETGDIFDAEVTKYFDSSYELMLYNITPKYESLKESILTNDEYDYFNVYDENGLVGEFPTYEDAKNACKDGCTINGVIQYGGDEYEETPLNEDINDKYKIFNVYISIDWELDGSYEEREEIGEFGDIDGWNNISDDFRSFLENSDFEGVEEIDTANIYGDYENINGLLYITFKDECTIKEAEERVYNILYKWDYKDTVIYEFNGPKRDVDDWDSLEVEFNVNINDVEILKIEPNIEE